MKNKLSTYTAFFIVLLFSSCSKDSPGQQEEKVDPCNFISQVFSYHPYGNPTYQSTAINTYDEKGRIKTISYGAFDRAAYTYTRDSIVVIATNIHQEDISDIYYLDQDGRIIRSARHNNSYSYNAEGYLSSFRRSYGYNGQITGYTSYTLEYKNGNLVEVRNLSNPAGDKVLEYLELPNQALGYVDPLFLGGAVGIRNEFFLIKSGFFGRQSKNLLKNTGLKSGIRYSDIRYQFDQKGRVSGIEEAYQFIYQCP